jgi:hypothetical protein
MIEVTRNRPIFMGVLSSRWRVFIDGAWVGQAPRGKPVRFPVTPGPHAVKVWTYKGASCSNELSLDVAPGAVRSLTCGLNPPPIGLSQLPSQVNTMRNVFRDGGIAKGALFRYEDVGLGPQPS